MPARSTPDFRAAMLRSMLNRHPRAAALAAWLPTPEPFQRDAPAALPRAPADILWRDLLEAEREEGLGPGHGADAPASALTYFLRRAALARHRQWAHAGRRLPAFWLDVLRLSAGDAQTLCESLGLRVIAASAIRLDPQAAAARLAPLGTALAARAVAHMTEKNAPRAPRDLAASWDEAIAAASSTRRSHDLAAELGRRLLAGILARFDAADRDSSSRLCRSTLCRMLKRTPSLSPPDAAGDTRLAERLVIDALTALRC